YVRRLMRPQALGLYDCTLPHRCRNAVLCVHSKIWQAMSQMGHELSIHHPGQNSNLATDYPSAADLIRRLRSIHTLCQKRACWQLLTVLLSVNWQHAWDSKAR